MLIKEEATEAVVKLTCPRLTSRDLLALDENSTLVAEFASRIEYHYSTVLHYVN